MVLYHRLLPPGRSLAGLSSPVCKGLAAKPSLARGGSSRRKLTAKEVQQTNRERKCQKVTVTHPAAPMVEEVSDFRNRRNRGSWLAIEKGLVQRRRPPAVYRVSLIASVRCRPRADGRQGLARPRIQEARPDGWGEGKLGGRRRLVEPTGFRHPERLHGLPRSRGYAQAQARRRLHAVLVLSAADPRAFAGMVPDAELPPPPRSLAPARTAPSLDCNCPGTWKSASRTRTRSAASWSCRCGRRAPKGGPRINWPRSSRAIA